MNELSPAKTFEKMYKSSYSHGLESIYALENVDINTVRPLITENQYAQVPSYQEPEKSCSLAFDFGPQYSEEVEPFILVEPIHFLNLSSHAEKILLSKSISQIQDLIRLSTADLLVIKGLGQGHIDEIQKKLTLFLHNRSVTSSGIVNFESLLRNLLGGEEKKKKHLMLEPFELAQLYPLDAAETLEVRHLSPEKKKELSELLFTEYRSEINVDKATDCLKQIADAILIPWIRRRGGIATREELEERLQNVSEIPSNTLKILFFLSEACFESRFAFDQNLIPLGSDLYGSDGCLEQSYRLIQQKAHSYFYKPDIAYSFALLVNLIENEFALEWISFPESFVEKALRHDNASFRVRKSSPNELTIKLS